MKLAESQPVAEEMNADRHARVLHNASTGVPWIPLSVFLFSPLAHNTWARGLNKGTC